MPARHELQCHPSSCRRATNPNVTLSLSKGERSCQMLPELIPHRRDTQCHPEPVEGRTIVPSVGSLCAGTPGVEDLECLVRTRCDVKPHPAEDALLAAPEQIFHLTGRNVGFEFIQRTYPVERPVRRLHPALRLCT